MLLVYIDCFAGLSGETLLDALVSAGLDRKQFESALERLPGAEHHKNNGTGLTLDSYRKAIAASAMPPLVKQTACAVLNKLKGAEAASHYKEAKDKARIAGEHEWCEHELRAAVGVVLGLSLLRIDRVECSPLRVGWGLTNGASNGHHEAESRLAFSPITAEILRGSPAPVYGGEQGSESVTPIGAALVATLVSSFGQLPPMTIHGIGYGRERNGTNVAISPARQTRVFLGERAQLEAVSVGMNGVHEMPVAIKVESVPEQPTVMTKSTAIVKSIPAEMAAADLAEADTETGAEAMPYIGLSEDWVALSIKGHQQSGRQRV